MFLSSFLWMLYVVGQGSAMRHFRPNQHGSEPKVPDLGDSSGLCFLHLGPHLHLGRRLRSDTDVSLISIQQRHHLHDTMVDRCMYLPMLLDPVPLWQERIRIALCDGGLSYFIIHHDWHHAFKTPQTCQYHLVVGNHHLISSHLIISHHILSKIIIIIIIIILSSSSSSSSSSRKGRDS